MKNEEGRVKNQRSTAEGNQWSAAEGKAKVNGLRIFPYEKAPQLHSFGALMC